MIDAHLVYTGRVSGKRYEWPKAGDIVLVLSEDLSNLLEKRIGVSTCCGDPTGNRVFQTVE